MESHFHAVIGWLFSNVVAVFVGGFLGYRFGDPVKNFAASLLKKFDK